MTISEQEIEIERLKTTLISLNSKCAIVDDHQQDVHNRTEMHYESESIRSELHVHIESVSTKVH
jgi:hypothetical protein